MELKKKIHGKREDKSLCSKMRIGIGRGISIKVPPGGLPPPPLLPPFVSILRPRLKTEKQITKVGKGE